MFPYRDINELFLNELDDKTLGRMCRVNLEAKKICEDDQFWLRRILKIYGEEILKAKKEDETYKQFYTSPNFIEFTKKYSSCLAILTVPKLSQMVIDDFYNPSKGFINLHFTRDLEAIIYLLLKIVLQRDNSEKIRNLITEAKNNIPDYRLEEFDTETFELTDKEKTLFRTIIDIPIGRIEILKNTGKVRPEFIKSLGLNESPEIFKFISFIHNGFKTGRLPLDIKWDELCTHPYMFSTLTF